MSFILDALKKSESDRLKKNAPGLSHVPDKAQEKSASHWIWIVVVLIVINVAVLTMMYLKPDRAPIAATTRPPAESSVPAPPATTAAAARVPEPVTDRATNPSAEAQPGPGFAESPPPVVREPVSSTALGAAAASRTGNDSPGITESHVTFNDLRVEGLLSLPDLHLDIHVFSERPENRFVFVNMSKYKEGATLDEGPAVAEITPEGVILQHRGMTFLLPRE